MSGGKATSHDSPVIAFLRCYGGLVAAAVVLAVFNTVYVVTGTIPSPAAQMIMAFALPLYMMSWVEADAYQRRCTPCFDFGFFLFLTWLISIPAYLIWTRGWRGLLVILLFVGLFIFPIFSAVFVALGLAIARM